jgi:hypothetical protein
MANKRPDLSELVEAGGGMRRQAQAADPTVAPAPPAIIKQQKSREGTVPITVMQHEDVRTQLKMLALEQRDTIENLVAQALNSLFAKHGKPEIAVIKKRKGRAA